MNKSQFSPLPRANPVDANMSAIALKELLDALGGSDARMRGVMVLRDGKIVGEHFWPPYKPEDRVWVYSISKSFTSTAAGFACDEGKLSLEDRVVSFFPDKCPVEISENLNKMTLRDLLSMTTGHHVDTTPQLMVSPDGDWVKTFLSLEVEHEPGTYFVYNSGASYIVSAIVQKATGETLMDYLTPRLFEPLGFDKVEWDECPMGVAAGGWGIVLRLEDLAKLGQLYLDKGVWNGRRILSENWVAEATRKQSDNSNNPDNQSPDWIIGYGLHFWRCRHGAFRADGAAGQYCIVLPEQNAVVAMMSEVLDMQALMDIVWEKLLPNFDSVASPLESKLAGKKYTLEANFIGLKSVEFAFKNDSAELVFSGRDGEFSLKAGRGTWADNELLLPFGMKSLFPQFTLTDSLKSLSARCGWADEHTLEIQWYYRQTPHGDSMLCTFGGEEIKLLWPAGPAAMFMGIDDVTVSGRVE